MRTFRWVCSGCRKTFVEQIEPDVNPDDLDAFGLCPPCADEERRLTDAAFAADIQLPCDDGIPF